MSLDALHAAAAATTPENVSIPKTWSALFVWAVGKWGTGAVFLALLFPVYMDFKASNQQFIAQSQATVVAIQNLANKIEQDRTADALIAESIRRIESELSSK